MRSVESSVGHAVERGIRYAHLAVFRIGLRRRNPGAVANAIVTLVGTYVPDLVERAFDVEFRSWQRVYVGLAMIAHAVGMLGPYDEVWWWDHLTHALSATVLGGFVFARARRRARDPRPRVLAAVLGAGLLWELVEYLIHATADRLGFEPVLVFYSRADVAFDLVFDLVGALLVLAVGDRFLDNLVPAEE